MKCPNYLFKKWDSGILLPQERSFEPPNLAAERRTWDCFRQQFFFRNCLAKTGTSKLFFFVKAGSRDDSFVDHFRQFF